jgi:exodeoxyribonuclease VII large subunit
MDLFEQRKIYSIYELTADIKRTLEKFGIIWVQGEISNFKHHSSGHMYFALKDEKAQIKAAFFRNSNALLRFRPEDGMEVLARGRISVYEPRGDYQLIVEFMEPKGLGSLQLAFEQLKQKLRKEGLFDEDRKRTLPMLPRKIGIVTSPTGAAIRDMLRILERRNSTLDVLLYPARVQGQGAAEEIAAGIRYLNSRNDLDVIIVGRGGGSIEDLWAFNEEIVARAIHESRLPVVSAVGHEVDYTIADFVADLRAPTPSAAAEMVSAAREELLATVSSLRGRMVQAIKTSIDRKKLDLERLANNRAFNIAPNKIRDFQQRFDEATLRMTQAMRQYMIGIRHREQVAVTGIQRIDLKGMISIRREKIAADGRRIGSAIRLRVNKARSGMEVAVGQLNALSPLAILQRGYAICSDEQHKIVKNAAAVSAGDSVEVKLGAGDLICRVEATRID